MLLFTQTHSPNSLYISSIVYKNNQEVDALDQATAPIDKIIIGSNSLSPCHTIKSPIICEILFFVFFKTTLVSSCQKLQAFWKSWPNIP